MSDDLVKRLNDACVGHPHAKIQWPHRLPHEAADRIKALEGEVRWLHTEIDIAIQHIHEEHSADPSKAIGGVDRILLAMQKRLRQTLGGNDE